MRADWLLSGILAGINRLCGAQGLTESPELPPLGLGWINDILEAAREDSEEMRVMLDDLEADQEDY